jgi:hypothetical protein
VRFADETEPDKLADQSDDPKSAVQRALLKIAGQADGNKKKVAIGDIVENIEYIY